MDPRLADLRDLCLHFRLPLTVADAAYDLGMTTSVLRDELSPGKPIVAWPGMWREEFADAFKHKGPRISVSPLPARRSAHVRQLVRTMTNVPRSPFCVSLSADFVIAALEADPASRPRSTLPAERGDEPRRTVDVALQEAAVFADQEGLDDKTPLVPGGRTQRALFLDAIKAEPRCLFLPIGDLRRTLTMAARATKEKTSADLAAARRREENAAMPDRLIVSLADIVNALDAMHFKADAAPLAAEIFKRLERLPRVRKAAKPRK